MDLFAGRFELIDPIGVGGAGTVWRAWDRRQERMCAAKILRQRDAGALLRFVREQGRRLDHPNVLSPYGWAADDDMALLAMDLVGGGSVDNLVADFGPLPPRLAAELLSQLLGALDKIHTAGVLHRDVKPANLLLEMTGTERPMLRLSDFGIAIAMGEPRLTVHGTVVGTPGYLAPEVLAGAAPSPQQDLYAAGVTAWQLLTGAEPPDRGSLPTRPPDATGPIWDVVTDLTRADPADRLKSAAEALAALAPSLAEPLVLPAQTPDGELIEVFDHLPELAPESRERRKGGRRTAVVVAAVMVAVVGGCSAAALAVFDPFEGSPLPPVGPSTGASETATPARSADPQIRAGQPCGWQVAGSVEKAADGTRVECRQQGTSYLWVKVS